MNALKKLSFLFCLIPSILATAQSRKTNTETFRHADIAENKVAILPLSFSGDGNPVQMDEMKYRLQELVADFLDKSARELIIQDPIETNVLLRENELSDANIQSVSPKELAEILGVEYVVIGNVLQLYGDKITSINSQTNAKNKNQTNQNGVINSSQQIQTDVRITIYNDKGNRIFNQTRHSLLTTPNAYKNALHYILKRTPLYKR